MGKSNKTQVWRVLSVVSGFLLTLSVAGIVITNEWSDKINGFLNIAGTKLVETGDTTDTPIYYESEYSSAQEIWDANTDVAKRLEAEGAVLLRNENNALPLSVGAQVSVFGRSSVNLVQARDSNSSGVAVDLKTQFEANGNLSVNPTLYTAYQNSGISGSRISNTTSDMEAADMTICQILEPTVDSTFYTNEVRSSYANYSDAALVVISRSMGEGMDGNWTTVSDSNTTAGIPYLDLQDIERDLIEEANTASDNVVLLINSPNMVAIPDLEDLGVDAVLWIGGPGGYGLYAVSDILVGKTNPSGKLPDIMTTSSVSAPAMENFGDFTYSNLTDLDSALQDAYGGSSNQTRYSKYVVYTEGIYVGYKYYETRYEDTVLNNGNASSIVGSTTSNAWDYDDEVLYPFGYGLSYTTFEQTLTGVEETNDTYEVTVNVKNNGTVAGKSVVQIYGQSEYTEWDETYGIEKASVQLVGFEKTDELEAGGEVDVVVSVDKYQLATYDSVVNKGYILEAGDYYLTVGSDSHDAVNNILRAKGENVDGDSSKVHSWNLEETDTTTFANSKITGNEVTNQYDEVDLNYYGDLVEYLSRGDWNGTYPTALSTLEATAQMIEDLDFTYEPSENTDTSGFLTEQDNGLMLASLIGEDLDSEYWDLLIDQMSVDDLLTAVARACKEAITSVGKPFNYLQDHTTGWNKNTYYEDFAGYTVVDVDPMTELKPPQYPTIPIVAATFNKELVEELGNALAEDGLWLNVYHHYAPGANIHRTPYSGRNYEYYSEDGFLTSEMAAYQVRGARKKGLITYIKHLFLNDQERNRSGVSTFANEQSIREIYLRAFEGSFTKFYEEGNATNALMGGFNRVGTTWVNAHYNTMTNVLTNEWGFVGMADTDYALWTHMEAKSGLMAGTSVFAVTTDIRANELLTNLDTDADLYAKLREATKRNLYVVANSMEMNGISPTTLIVSVLVWYQQLLIALIVIFGLAFAATAGLLVYELYFKKGSTVEEVE